MSLNSAMTIYNRFQKIHVLLDDVDRHALRNIDLSNTQFHLLTHLNHHGQDGLTITELSNMLICTRSNATRLVQRLEERKLVQAQRGTKDRRLVRVCLTDDGRAIYNAALQAHQNSIVNRFGPLDESSFDDLDRLTAQIVSSLENHIKHINTAV